jgi:hypothetical protein
MSVRTASSPGGGRRGLAYGMSYHTEDKATVSHDSADAFADALLGSTSVQC